MSTSSVKYAYPCNLNVANFVSLKLSTSNYLLWETQVLSLIESQDLLGFINGDIIAPDSEVNSSDGNQRVPNPDFTSWVRTDRLVKAWITGTLSEEALGVVVGLKTSADVWKALGDAFSQNSQAREFELLAQLQVKKGNASLSDHLRDFKKTCDQLNAIGKPVTDQNKVFWLLSGLGPKYESFATTMLKPPVPSYADLIPLLQSHELRNRGHQSESFNHSMVYYSQRTSNGTKNSNKKGGNSYFTSKGKGFLQTGQSQFRSSFPPQSQPKNNAANPEGHPQICQICNKKGHEALKCWHRFNHSFQATDIPKALAAMHVTDSQDSEWFPDTGATAHITEDPGKLSNLVRYQGSDSVMVGNGNKLHISHIGDVKIKSGHSVIPLKDVLAVHHIQKSLLSVSQLTNDYPCSFEFDGNGFVIKELRTNKVLAKGSRKGGLYVLEDQQLQANFSTRFRTVDEVTWHKRLGHPQARVVPEQVEGELSTFTEWISPQIAQPVDIPTQEDQFSALERARLFTGDPPALDQTRDQLPILSPSTEPELTPLGLGPQSGEPLVVPNSTSPITIPSTISTTPTSNSNLDASPSS
ncbi:hypothetical protein RJ640_013834 [Escallonia rubra]|uniref:Retrovirus-related Pol polyprotein from transposon TNT 1-94-like beta-barrel domain-containing protein n=1 Tax=Escallonia rubra TaxID=112253 RepID=A0AA88UNF7_9ASTE|nr:hypothetical protein RJ640_013834 [Escallonia rubra]